MLRKIGYFKCLFLKGARRAGSPTDYDYVQSVTVKLNPAFKKVLFMVDSNFKCCVLFVSFFYVYVSLSLLLQLSCSLITGSLNNGPSHCHTQVISVTWFWSSLTQWVKLCASAPSTLWRAWMRNMGIGCIFTWARLTRPAESLTDRYVQQHPSTFSIYYIQSHALLYIVRPHAPPRGLITQNKTYPLHVKVCG